MKVLPLFFVALASLLAGCDGDKKTDPTNTADRKTIKSLTFVDSALADCVQQSAQKLAINYVDELTHLNCNNKINTYKTIQNITDIKQLTALTQLDLSYHGLKSVDLSALTKLKQLYLWSNPISQLNLISNNALLDLEVSTFADDGKALSSQFSLFWPTASALESVRLNLPTSYTVALVHLKNLKRAVVHNLTEPFIDRLAAPNLEYLSVAGSTSSMQFPAFAKPVEVQIKSAQLTSLMIGYKANIKSLVLDTPNLKTLPVASSLNVLNLKSTALTTLDISPAAQLTALTLGTNPNLTQVNMDPAQSGIKITYEGSRPPEIVSRKALKYLNFASTEFAQCVNSQGVTFVDELTELSCDSSSSERIQTLKGIEQLENLQRFNIFYSVLNDADFSALTKLTSITMRISQVLGGGTTAPLKLHMPAQSPLTHLSLTLKPGAKLAEPLNLSRFTGLVSVELLGINDFIFGPTASLSKLLLDGDYSASSLPADLTNIVDLHLVSPGIKSLNLPALPNLRALMLVLPNLPELTLPTGLNLQRLILAYMPIDRLNLTPLEDLEALSMGQMPNLTQLELPKKFNLTSVSVYGIGIVNWDFGGLSSLREIAIGGDATRSIKGIEGSRLESLELHGKQLASIDLLSCEKLRNLQLGGEKINSFNFAACQSLVTLILTGTAINSLDLTKHTQLEHLQLIENPIALDRIKLPGPIKFYDNPGCAGSSLPSCQF